MKKRMLVSAGFAGVAMTLFAWNETTLEWQGSSGGAMDDPTRWGKPAGTDISYSDATQYAGVFKGKGTVSLGLTLNDDFFFNRLYFQSQGTSYDFDLCGHVLRLYGAADAGFAFNANQRNQRVTVRNGVLSYQGCNRHHVNVGSEGNTLVFAGTEERPFVITNTTAFFPNASSQGTIVLSNTVVATSGKFTLSNSSGTLVLTGPRTRVFHPTDYFGPTGGSNVLEIRDGAFVDAEDSTNHKCAIVVGNAAGGNTLVIAGEGTQVVSTNYFKNTDSSVASLVVGKRSNGNFLHITDRASVTLSSKLLVGNPSQDTERGSAHNNRIRIDSNAVVKASDIWLGQMANRSSGGGTGYDQLAYFSSNTCEIADHARVTLANYGLKVGAESRVDFSSISVTGGARVSSPQSSIGAYGVSNALYVADGGVLYCAGGDATRGLYVGGANSTGTVFAANAGVIALTNTLFKMNGSSAQSVTCATFSNDSRLYARYLRVLGQRNRIVIDDSRFTVRTEAQIPYEEGADVEFVFRGENPWFDYRFDYVSSLVTRVFRFGTGVKFSFDIPETGYASAPITSLGGIEITGRPTLAVDISKFQKTGGKQVLMDAGSGRQISISDEAMESLKTSAGIASIRGAKLQLAENGRYLVFSIPKNKGLILLLR